MLEVREGSAWAYEELVRRYQSRLVSLFEHLIGKRGQAEDLAQEVFLRIYRARTTYRPQAKFATWLFTIANHVAANARRSCAARPTVNLAPADSSASGALAMEELATAGSGQLPTRRMDRTEAQEMVRKAIALLPERQRMAVLLSKFEDMSYEEIAQSMRLSTKAVKSLLSRARENLRDVLAPYLESGQAPASLSTS